MSRIRFQEGDVFVVPLRDGTNAIGLIARRNPKGVLLGYFFGPARPEPPLLLEVNRVTKRDAALVAHFGHLNLVNGSWSILGRLPGWDRAEWPMPTFVRYEELSGRVFRVFYDDDDPNKMLREEQIAPGVAEQGPPDRLMGPGSVERELTHLL